MDNPQHSAFHGDAKQLALLALQDSLAQVHSGYAPARPYQPDFQDQADSQGSALEYWRVLWRHKVAILATSFLGLILGVLAGVFMQPVYRANTSIEVLSVNEDFMNMRPTQPAVTSGVGTDVSVSEEETQATLLQSDPLVARVYDKLNPNPTPPPPMATSGWRRWFHLHEASHPSDRERLLDRAVRTLKVTNTPRTRILGVSVECGDPQLAVAFTQTLVQEFIAQNINARFAGTQQTSEWLAREISDARSRLRASEEALQAYAGKSGLVFTALSHFDSDSQSNIGTEKLQQIQVQLSTATNDRIAKQSTYELAKNSPPDTLADVVNDPSLQSLGARLDDATRNLASLSSIYNSGYSKVAQAKAEEAVLREAFLKKRTELLDRIETDYQGAVRREHLLADAYVRQQREVAGEDEKTVQYNMLKREADSNRQLYDTMLQQTKQAALANALRASNVRLIDPAYLDPEPVSPKFKLNAALGLFTGLLGCVAFLFIRERADRTFREPSDMKLAIDMQALGAIPHIRRPRRRIDLTRKSGKAVRSRELDLHSDAAVAVTKIAPAISDYGSIWETRKFEAESFLSVLTSLLVADQDNGSGRIFVFTSPEPGAGKTTVVSNLAIAAAQIGKRVVLIDADLRRPRLHDVFGLTRDLGLGDLLVSGTTEEPEPSIFLQPSGIVGLRVLTGGQPQQAGLCSFHSPKFANLLGRLRMACDLVLIDVPPALHVTDARVIGRLADGVVLIARAEQTSRDALVEVRDRLTEDRIHVVGCVLNDWAPDRSAQKYVYDYSISESKWKA